ncbi:ChbG/HpnK family deacetylase [Coxiella burnetii]|uniref:ChbG/HpnK family deacetylase n=1 Tax=Coxiella burnetii TaxID=777 RepID=UPI00051F18AE|nr:ChbG/HpnK family deacetylase [Coxiella burnetii]AIT63513.1 Putative cellobiose phosphorylase [Coxiella burnetii str. Namibia]
MKSITLCADDYGYTAPVCQAILKLLDNQRLSAVSCIVNTPLWKEYASLLKPFQLQCDIGLHFNLTEGYSLTDRSQFPNLNYWLVQSHLHRIDRQWLAAELNAQLDQFEQSIMQLPDFIDGHQHVHHLPIIRDILLQVYRRRLQRKKPYIRVASNGWFHPFALKPLVITITGAKRLKKMLRCDRIPHNPAFSGIYDFSNKIDYAEHFRRFLNWIDQRGIIMCHPGWGDDSDKDAIADARRREYDYLQSEQFLKDCQRANVRLTRFYLGHSSSKY